MRLTQKITLVMLSLCLACCCELFNNCDDPEPENSCSDPIGNDIIEYSYMYQGYPTISALTSIISVIELSKI